MLATKSNLIACMLSIAMLKFSQFYNNLNIKFLYLNTKVKYMYITRQVKSKIFIVALLLYPWIGTTDAEAFIFGPRVMQTERNILISVYSKIAEKYQTY